MGSFENPPPTESLTSPPEMSSSAVMRSPPTEALTTSSTMGSCEPRPPAEMRSPSSEALTIPPTTRSLAEMRSPPAEALTPTPAMSSHGANSSAVMRSPLGEALTTPPELAKEEKVGKATDDAPRRRELPARRLPHWWRTFLFSFCASLLLFPHEREEHRGD